MYRLQRYNYNLNFKDANITLPPNMAIMFNSNFNAFHGKLYGVSQGDGSLVEVAIRGKKWDPDIQGLYYTQQLVDEKWQYIDLPVRVSAHGVLSLCGVDVGVPEYLGNEVRHAINIF